MNANPKPCLLVVDDEPEICDSVAYLLGRKYRVLKAHSAAEAVELMAANDVQIIMTDQRMPDVTGVEMLQKLKSQYPEAVRILFTGYADIHSVIAAINQGHVYRYLTKPWQPDELENAIADAAAEYAKMVAHAKQLHECEERATVLGDKLHEVELSLESLKEHVRQLQEQINHLEQENARLEEMIRHGHCG